MSAAATWPGMLGGRSTPSRTNGLWTPGAAPRLLTGYSSNVKRTAGGLSRDADRGGDKGRDKPVMGRENTAARAAAAVPAVPPADVDWTALVERCIRGDGGAWAELVRSHHRRVYGMCYRFTGSAHDAEDLTQEVFLKLYGNLRSFNSDKGSFTTWITTLTRNLLVDHFRKSKQDRVTDSIDAGLREEDDSLSLGDRLEDPRPTPDDRLASKETQKMVQMALARISPDLREAVILRDLQDMDYKEIAQVLRVPEGTVKSRINRGRMELARLLSRNKKQASNE
jgi:RNA polymerase sigma-70 factor (ECF subfamily)